jgi:single-strand DNA-binding protein
VWGKQAEIAEKYLRKGKQVMVEGRIQYREYTDQAGVKKTITEIRCDNFVMLGRAEGQHETGGHDEDLPAVPPAGGHESDDIPF